MPAGKIPVTPKITPDIKPKIDPIMYLFIYY